MTKIEIQNLERVSKAASTIARVAEDFQDMTDKLSCLNLLRTLRVLSIVRNAQTFTEQTTKQYDCCIDDYLMTIDEHIEDVEESLNAK